MVKVHPVSNLQMRRQIFARLSSYADELIWIALIFSTLWSSTVHTVNFSLCDPACDWFSIEAYNAPKDGVVPAADYRLFLFGIGQMMQELL